MYDSIRITLGESKSGDDELIKEGPIRTNGSKVSGSPPSNRVFYDDLVPFNYLTGAPTMPIQKRKNITVQTASRHSRCSMGPRKSGSNRCLPPSCRMHATVRGVVGTAHDMRPPATSPMLATRHAYQQPATLTHLWANGVAPKATHRQRRPRDAKRGNTLPVSESGFSPRLSVSKTFAQAVGFPPVP